MTAQRILVLDGQSNPALACVRSLGRAGHTVFVATEYRAPLASWSRWCKGTVRLAGYTVPAFAALRRWALSRDITVVLPLSEESCTLLNAARDAWTGCGIRLGCPEQDVLVRAFDKARTLRRAAAEGVRIPHTWFPQSLDDARAAAATVGLPCVVKPRSSHPWDGHTVGSSLGNALPGDPSALDRAVLERRDSQGWPLVQEAVAGQARSAFALYDRGRPVAWFAMETLRAVRPLASPSSLRRSVPLDPRLREPAERLLTALEWHGPAMVEFLDDGVNAPCLMEVNGRFWNSLALAVAAGADFPAWWVAILTGDPLPSSREYAPGVAVRWLWGDVKRVLGTLTHGLPPGSAIAATGFWRAVWDLLGPQPQGTRLEMGLLGDPLPAIGEWVEACREVSGRLTRAAGRVLSALAVRHAAGNRESRA